MELLVEGLKEYRVLEPVRNPYYLDVEYHVLCFNHPAHLVPVQARETDGVCRLLFDVSGLHCVYDEMQKQSFSTKEFRQFLQDLKDLLTILDRHMLDIRQVDFEPQHIYRDREEGFCWFYLPIRSEDTVKDIENLFQWVMTVIDYNDHDMIQFAYHTYWYIRSHPFSEKSLQACMDYQPDDKLTAGAESYEEFFNQPEELSDYSLPSDYSYAEEEERKEETTFWKKTDRLFVLEILAGVMVAACLIIFAVFMVTAILNRQLYHMKYILAGCLLGALLFTDLCYRIRKKRKNPASGSRQEAPLVKEVPYPSYDHSWEEEGGTTVLGVRKDMLQPALRSTETGSIFVIDSFPFFIGSAEGINQLVISDPAVSRRHAAIIRGRQTGFYDLQDLRSTNGTWIGQKALAYENPVRLEPGIRIRFAAKSYEFIILDSPGGEGIKKDYFPVADDS